MKIEGEWHNKKQLFERVKTSLKKLLIKIERTDFAEVFFMLIIFLLVVIVAHFFIHRTFEEMVNSLVDWTMFSSALIASVITVFARAIKDWFYNRIEDDVKLELNVSELQRIYKDEAFEDATALNNEHIKNGMIEGEGNAVIPIVCCAKFDSKTKIQIQDNENSYYELPSFVEQNFSTLISAHQSSNIYNNLNVRVKDWRFEDNQFLMETERTFYLNSMATNRAMDYELDGGLTVRRVLGQGSKLVPLGNSRLSNHLGFNGMVESKDGMCPLVFRKKNVSIGKRTYGNSIGASLKTKYALTDGVFSFSGLINAVKNEIVDELGIQKDLIGEIHFLNAYREVIEGGKPQLFFVTGIKKTALEIEQDFMKYQMKKNGNDEEKMERDGDTLVWIKTEDIRNRMLFFAYHVTSNVSVFDGKKFNEARHDLQMLPSASGCMLFFQRYLARKND